MSNQINEQILEDLFEKYLEQGHSEEEAAKLMGYKTSEKGRSPGYKQIKNIKRTIIKKVKRNIENGDIDIF